ncbi:MAG: lamin tail domain-containing protein, partial [Chitinophagales bacterium]
LLTFSESMDSAALNVANYNISPGNISVANIFAENELLQTFTLILNDPINIGTVYELTLNNLSDCPGNALVGNTENFAIPEMPEANDVVISEIMPKPDPVVELPNQEYVELWNRSEKVLNLKDWAFSANNSSETLPDRLFLPGDRVILVPKENAADFEVYGEVLPLSRLPQLTNSAGTLLLFDNTEKVIDRVLYSDTWFSSSIKKEGGWALEIIDGNNLCQGEGNWIGSKDAKGGTPGQENSVAAENPDEIAPRLNYIVYEAQDSLVLFFDSPLDEAAVLSANFDLSPQDLGIGQVSWSALEPEKVRIKLQDSPRQNTIYTLTCSEIKDCAGNEVDENFNSARFGIPEKPEENAIVINEILFNANTGGSDFVELYNRSNKIFDLRDLVIARAPYGSQDDYDASAICSENGFQLLPGNFVVLTPDPENIAENYTVEDERTLLEVDDMPNYLNSDGIVALLNKSLEPLDQLEYIEDWHFQLLQSVKGVSLERINYERPTQDEDNWHSAAEAAGFATPGRENSNFSANFSSENNIHLEPKLFSPDGDGYNDLLQIHYQFNQPGYVANIRIFDGEGRPVRRLTNNKLLEAKGYLTWDGTTDDQTKARIGTYILMFEVFEPNGNTSKFKKSCVLGGRLD